MKYKYQELKVTRRLPTRYYENVARRDSQKPVFPIRISRQFDEK